jgi:outer membrane protein assembly factor BamB
VRSTYLNWFLAGSVLLVQAVPSHAEGCLGLFPFESRVLAFSAKTGQPREVLRRRGVTCSALSAAPGVLYLGNACQVEAIHAKSGKIRWTFKADYLVYDIKPLPHAILVGSGSTLHAIHPATGKLLWQYASKGAVGPLMLSEGLVLFSSHNGLTAVDHKTGQQQWQLAGPGGSDEVSFDGKNRVCSWNATKTFVSDLKNGNLLWQEDSPPAPFSPYCSPVNVAAGAGRLYFVSAADPAKATIQVAAKDPGTRQQLWQTKLNAQPGKLMTVHSLAGQVLLANGGYVEGESSIFLLDAATGQLRWHFNTGKPVWQFTKPAASMATIWVSDGMTTVWALDRLTGKLRWQHVLAQPKAGNQYAIQPPLHGSDAVYVIINELTRHWGAVSTPK